MSLLQFTQRWSCRSQEAHALFDALQDGPALRPVLHVHGDHGSGKTAMVRCEGQLCQSLHVQRAWPSFQRCRVCRDALRVSDAVVAHIGPLEYDGTIPLLWSHIINAWRAALKQPMKKVEDDKEALHAVEKLRSPQNRPLYILVDPVEPSIDADMLAAILLFPELCLRDTTAQAIGVILVSTSAWDKLFPQRVAPAAMPQPIFFRKYTQDQLLQLVARERPGNVTPHFWESFLRSCVRPACRVSLQLSDIRTLVRELQPFLQQALASAAEDSAAAQIVGEVMPHAQRHIRHMQAHYAGCPVDIHSIDYTQPVAHACVGSYPMQPGNGQEALTLEVPFLCKFLLLAAFLCANNRATADKRVFVAASGPKAKRKDTQATDRQGEAAREEAVSQGQVRLLG
jgi:Origin recognition complex (ORC) subunit 5 C-terminus